MSKVTEIIMHGMKGQTGTQPLTGRDIIVGKNGAGKTTRAQAIGIGLLGYVPGGGKLATETAKLATAEQMTVGIKTETFEVLRKYTKKGGKVEVAVEISPSKNEKTATAKDQRIEQELGRFPAMLDFGEFVNLTDTKRREFIYSLLESNEEPDEGWTERLAQRIHENITTESQEEADYLNEAIAEITTQLDDFDGDTQSSLKYLHDNAKEQVSYWKKERDLANNAAVKVSEQKNQLETTDRDMDAVRAALETAQAEKIELEREIAKGDTLTQSTIERNERLKFLREELPALQNECSQKNDVAMALQEAKDDLTYNDFEGEKHHIKEELHQHEKALESIIAERDALRSEYTKIQAEVSAKKQLGNKLQNMNGFCVIDQKIPCNQNFSKYSDELFKEVGELDELLKAVEINGSQLNERMNAPKQKIKELQEKQENVNKREIEMHKRNSEITAFIAEMEKKVAYLEATESHAGMLQKELEEIEPKDRAFWPLPEVHQTKEASKKKSEEIAQLTFQLEKIQQAKNSILSIQGAMKDEKEATTLHKIWQRIAETVGPKGMQMELIGDALTPITSAVQEKLNLMGIDRQFFFQTKDDAGKEVFQFGWETGGSRRNFNALSTGEQLLLMIALMTTIIEKVNPPLKMLTLDNTENLDSENLMKVLHGLHKAGERLDNIVFIGVLNLAQEEVPQGWKVWHLEKEMSNDE